MFVHRVLWSSLAIPIASLDVEYLSERRNVNYQYHLRFDDLLFLIATEVEIKNSFRFCFDPVVGSGIRCERDIEKSLCDGKETGEISPSEIESPDTDPRSLFRKESLFR